MDLELNCGTEGVLGLGKWGSIVRVERIRV